ncbi:HK97 family phage prohead protease [Sulfitobacter sp. 1A16787]|uniref:HK97 family phage prohead protease n=1 Tax=Sulfitobacter sp. 1A16787 TaxID=3368571 RepID=UPI00374720C7
MNKTELRFTAPLELREAEGEQDTVRVEGYAAVYNERANIAGIFEEILAPGALDGRLGDDVKFLVNHRDLPLARTTSGTLQLSLDARGLKISAVLDRTDPDVARIVPKIKRGDMSKMSYAFEVDSETWDESGDMPLRTINKVRRLHDVALVTDPAYQGTEIALRSLEAHRGAEAPGADSAADLARAGFKSRLAALI